jgi:hypothetical protein
MSPMVSHEPLVSMQIAYRDEDAFACVGVPRGTAPAATADMELTATHMTPSHAPKLPLG